jgi:hypothetical protein
MCYVNIDIDIDDFMNSMDRRDRNYLFTEMQKDGYISKDLVITKDGEVELPTKLSRNLEGEDVDPFNIAVSKMYGNSWRMSKEDEEAIIQIAKKYPLWT